MAKDKSLGSIKRFGPRYGRTIKKKYAIIEKEQRKLHECPYCNYKKVKRVSKGIWKCTKCNSKFTGKAYSIKKEIATKKKTKELEEQKEPEEEIQEGENK